MPAPQSQPQQLNRETRTVVRADSVKVPRYPVSRTVPETIEDLKAVSPADLKQPSNMKTKIEYDPVTGIYSIVTLLGDTKIGTPIHLTQEEYFRYQEEQAKSAFWKEKTRVDRTKKADAFSLTDMQFDLGFGEKIFGEGGVRLRTQGSIETKFGVKNTKVDNPSLSENARNKTIFNFEPQIQMNVNGKVGDKIDVNMNYDTEATFDYDAKSIKLRYDGKEDEIIKVLEAGNVSLPVNSSLITGGTSLFGVKAGLQFGKLSVTTVVSQQNAQTKTVNLDGGVQTRSFELTPDNYDENRHFFLSHYFRDHYDKWMSKLPYISSGITITKVEVWVTNKEAWLTNNTSLLEKARNVVAFTDMGESQVISNPYWHATGQTIPSNASNDLYQVIIGQYSGARTFTEVNTVFAPLNPPEFI
jgi:cell surface protein SprA